MLSEVRHSEKPTLCFFWHNGYRYFGVMNYIFTNTAEDRTPDYAETSTTHYYHGCVELVSRVYYHLTGPANLCLDLSTDLKQLCSELEWFSVTNKPW